MEPTNEICKQTDMKDKIYTAAYLLQPAILSKLLSETDNDVLLEYNYGLESTLLNLKRNILESLCMAMLRSAPTTESKHFTNFKFANDTTKNDMCDVIKIILEKCPALITKKCYALLRCDKNHECVLELLNQYDKQSDNTCMICDGDDKIDMIFPTNNFCECKIGHIHIKCIVKLIDMSSDGICKTCATPFCRNEIPILHNGKRDPRIYFPKINVYKQPLLSMYTDYTSQKYKGLNLAIAYLQVKRVKELLSEINNDAFRDYVVNGREMPSENVDGNADYYAILKKDNTGLHIRDMPYTNLPRSHNLMATVEIERMLNDKLIECL